jgi:benzoate-CoA ligase family protein
MRFGTDMGGPSPGREADEAAGQPYNAAVDLLERNLAPGRADRPYLLFGGRAWAYGEVAAAADGAGAGLLDLGVDPGDRVLLALRDRPEFVAAFWGALKAGLIPVPVAQGLAPPTLRFILSDSAARAVVCDPASAGTVSAVVGPGSTPVILAGGPLGPGMLTWEQVCGRPAVLKPAPTLTDDIAVWLYTSGTTGKPKAAMHRHRHLRDGVAGLSRQVMELGPDDVVLSTSKMFFSYGLGNSVYLSAAAGAAAVIDDAPAVPARAQGLIDRWSPTLMLGVPAFFAQFTALPSAFLPASVRMAISAGEALPVDLFERFRSRFGLSLLDGLGSTEAFHHVTSNRPDDIMPGSVGRPLEGWTAKVLDENQEPIGEGVPGELWISGPTTFVGYWGRPDLTARAYRGRWMRTGDLVRMVEGRIFHLGRVDDLIKVGGVWVAPAEIEAVLRSHPQVEDAAAVASRDVAGLPRVRAFVVTDHAGANLAGELDRLCRKQLDAHKVPRIVFLDQLPRTPSGKVQRYLLRDPDNLPSDV